MTNHHHADPIPRVRQYNTYNTRAIRYCRRIYLAIARFIIRASERNVTLRKTWLSKREGLSLRTKSKALPVEFKVMNSSCAKSQFSYRSRSPYNVRAHHDDAEILRLRNSGRPRVREASWGFAKLHNLSENGRRNHDVVRRYRDLVRVHVIVRHLIAPPISSVPRIGVYQRHQETFKDHIPRRSGVLPTSGRL